MTSVSLQPRSDKNNLHFGTIICALGFRYKNYCSNIVRTIMVEPTEKMQENYKYLLELEEELINSLKDGAKLSEVYEKIRTKCQDDHPELVDKLTPNLGFLIGIEFREPNFLISNKCNSVVKAGMTFQVSIGFSDLVNSEAKEDEGKKYSLFIGDTIQINKDEPATVYTQAKKKIESVGIFIKASAKSKIRPPAAFDHLDHFDRKTMTKRARARRTTKRQRRTRCRQPPSS